MASRSNGSLFSCLAPALTAAHVCALLPSLASCAPASAPASASNVRSDAPVAEATFGIRLAPPAPATSSSLAAQEPQPTGSVPVDLAQVVRACVLSDPAILVALESVELARADRTQSGLLPNPGLTISHVMMPFPGDSFDAESKQGGPPQLDIGVSYSLGTLLFGTRRADMKATELGVEVALAEHANVARQRILEAIVAYYDVLEARELLEIDRAEVTLLERVRDVTEQRLSLGPAGALELDQIRVVLFESRRRLLREQAAFDNAASRLRARLGRTEFAHRAEAAGPLERAAPPAPPSVATALALAEEHRPDFLALRRRLARSRAELTREQRAAWPSVEVSAGYTRQFQEQSVGFPDANSWGAGLDLSLPVFDRNQGNIAHARASARQVDLLIAAARIDLRVELEQAIRDYELAVQLQTLRGEEAVLAASAALKDTEEAHGAGAAPLLEVLASQAAFREVLREDVAVRAELRRALHRVNAVVGTALLR
jgi:outer membrane protein, heavy metal efflux system